MRRRALLIPMLSLVALLLGGGVVGAVKCGGGDCLGTDDPDTLKGTSGADTIKAGDGADYIEANDGYKDIIDCGRGDDTVYFDKGKDVLSNCEHKFPS